MDVPQLKPPKKTNESRKRTFKAYGLELTVKQWCDITGLTYTCLYQRITCLFPYKASFRTNEDLVKPSPEFESKFREFVLTNGGKIDG